jgi:hypothetical protein
MSDFTPTNGTFTKDQIREAVITWDEGCMEQKVRFLNDCFGISLDPVDVSVSVTVTIDPYDSNGEENDPYAVVNKLQSVLDYNVGASDFEVESVEFSVRN